MAFSLRRSSLSKKDKDNIRRELMVKSRKTQFCPDPEPFYIYNSYRKDDVIYLPLGCYKDWLGEFPHNPREYSRTNLTFVYDLYTKMTDPLKRGRDQDVVAKQALLQLKENHSVFISCFTGYGKTSLGTFMLCKLGYKTAVLCHSNIIKDQWKSEILKFTDGKVKIQMVQGRKPLDADADVYIIGIQKAKTMSREELIDIGLVIVDEAHICTVTAFTSSLLRFQPMFLLGLSATPERGDGLEKLLYTYFGPRNTFIQRDEVKDFTVVKYRTKYQPVISYQIVRGRTTLAWTDMMTSLSKIEDRWKEIANIAISEPKHKIIILCDRKMMAQNIYDYLVKKGDSAELLIGTKKKWDKTKRILVAGVKKGGVGLNDPELTMLILAADMKNVKQCEGRIRTTNNLIYDVVDNYSTLENHWKERRKWYIRRGATIVNEIVNDKNKDSPRFLSRNTRKKRKDQKKL